MRTFELTYPHTLTEADIPETVCAIGFFDGIHKGHQRLIEKAVEVAKEKNMESAVITFHPHPSVVLKKGTERVQYITPLREKQEILQQMNVDRLYIIKFNEELSKLSPEDFIDHFIIGLHIKHLVAGFDYSFGHKGAGNMSNISDYSRGRFDYTVIDKVTMDDEKVSSTRIRDLLKQGEVATINRLLGRPLKYTSVVIHGAQRGGPELGYPTANLRINEDALLPKLGVYAVKVRYKNAIYEGMASVGTNPTFKEDKGNLSVEVNIFDYNNDLYGEELQLEWHEFIRDEKKFAGKEELIAQLADDEETIRNYFR
ncbi:bifunctional riboflavin kinase/FAD synthetase [Oceanobacillus alkalisoli]|uniref:bifunctional riboflavin kinase/FAD synthetase n=1 Tax=Oceanobacillus alkalisoli TaxID=2925113 RepID=UPI001EE489E0|nr:bifunctional riboflavin kinase/FAD synthetase [Oceanobacillus alkalisoli]MCG5103446.1 bifunctional riboflavin kinase/FAD synthetase [Oceanobacillus alkalisoli]